VVGTGGYVCGPVLLMAAMSKIPCIIQEQNTIPGLTNRILSRFVRKIAVAFDEAVKFFPDPKRVIVTGNPVRPEIASISKEEGTKAFNLNPRKTVLLVFGGGQGARSINNALLEAIPNLLEIKELQILHSTGKDNFESFYGEVIKIQGVKEGLKRRQLIIEPYIDKMPLSIAKPPSA
jgi:UDP-N-acetylglucosamine--N-acetylmuramyl-(pentapeptide) pyrophosphoryl-undecaprenol N-acetylglucosamine transferase